MSFKIKDRVLLKKEGNENAKGTIVKLQYKNSQVKTCCVLWDKDWPVTEREPRLFYYKPDDLKKIDTWRV